MGVGRSSYWVSGGGLLGWSCSSVSSNCGKQWVPCLCVSLQFIRGQSHGPALMTISSMTVNTHVLTGEKIPVRTFPCLPIDPAALSLRKMTTTRKATAIPHHGTEIIPTQLPGNETTATHLPRTGITTVRLTGIASMTSQPPGNGNTTTLFLGKLLDSTTLTTVLQNCSVILDLWGLWKRITALCAARVMIWDTDWSWRENSAPLCVAAEGGASRAWPLEAWSKAKGTWPAPSRSGRAKGCPQLVIS